MHCSLTNRLESKQSGSCESRTVRVYIPSQSPSPASIQLGHDIFKCIDTRASGSWCRDISNTQDAGLSLERSAAAGEGQRELSCQSCMQQAVQYHITSTSPPLTDAMQDNLLCKVIPYYKNQTWVLERNRARHTQMFNKVREDSRVKLETAKLVNTEVM